tara:strand:- start:1191 stop:2513 length:1323 start_codon:yes stop_codon:yes gene_type:complete
MSEIIAREVQKLEMAPDEAFVTLYEVELTEGAEPLYFHSENTENAIKFNNGASGTQPKEYNAFPIVMSGIEIRGDGAQNRPSITIPNVESLFKSGSVFDKDVTDNKNDFQLDDLVGKRVTRRQTLSKYVEEVGVDTTRTSHFQFPKATYIIDRIASKTSIAVTFELASPFDLADVKVPSRVVTGKYCPWVYKQWTESNTNVKSACYWKNTLSDGTNDVLLFFTIDDEPLVLKDDVRTTDSQITLLHDTTHASRGGASYGKNGFAFHNGIYYQCLIQGTTSDPFEGSGNWRVVRTYELWRPGNTYEVNEVDNRQNDYVYDNGIVYKAMRRSGPGTTLNPGPGAKVPADNPAFWMQADVCGKLLQSCKARYQASVLIQGGGAGVGFNVVNPNPRAVNDRGTDTTGSIANYTGVSRYHGAPLATFNNNISLPFGGFPGTRRIR